MIGKTLGHYTVSALIGRGGMGEVYKAKDQKLGRDIAIKVLPQEFAEDTDRVARFQREAKLLASLNHPNIAAIHGLEESDGTHFLVLELIEGDTLADRLKHGAIPVEESLKLALQIAEALEAAHEKGVIHRDLKPANIKVTPDGKVKVLDFGLAKAFAGEQEEMILSDSPTISVAATQKGVILGTAAYMSPEQAKGKTVDRRADVWAFGCVVFEMLTGRFVFAADDVSQTLARVLEREPDFSTLPQNLHPKILEMLDRCLEKEVKNRYSGISDARVDIQKALADPRGVFVQPATIVEPRKRLRLGLPWVATAIVLTAIIAGVAVWKLKPPGPRPVTRFYHELPEGQQFSKPEEFILAVSPDGSKFVYCTNEGLCLRSLDKLEARLIAGTDTDVQSPFFSPDGKWIGYHSRADKQLKKIVVGGGMPVALCDAGRVSGASWGADNMIVYSDHGRGVKRISASGGVPQLLVERFALVPQLLPDGKSLMFTDTLTSTDPQIVVQSLESGERRVLVKGFAARYLRNGYLVYGFRKNLYAVPFDVDTLEVTGERVPIADVIGGEFAISESGTLVYAPGTSRVGRFRRTLVWVDRDGKEEPLSIQPDDYRSPRISPDGTKVALALTAGGNQDIWIWDLVRKTPTRLTLNKAEDAYPLWTPDGKRIVFYSTRGGETCGLYWRAADGTGEPIQICSVPGNTIPLSWSRDGRDLILEIFSGGFGYIATLSMEGDSAIKQQLYGKFNQANPQVSPDGRWIAYHSNESGQAEVYVRSFPNVNSGKLKISTGGGQQPRWSPDGRELFYRTGDMRMMAVTVETEPSFRAGLPKELFRDDYSFMGPGQAWDISPDGKRFLMMKEIAADESEAVTPRRINVVLNWFEELKERVPVH